MLLHSFLRGPRLVKLMDQVIIRKAIGNRAGFASPNDDQLISCKPIGNEAGFGRMVTFHSAIFDN